MTTSVHCDYTAGPASTPSLGSITLQNCTPDIANTETLSSWDVIGIVGAIVLFGLAVQWIMHRVNRSALAKLKTDLTAAAHDVADAAAPVIPHPKKAKTAAE